MEKNGKKYCTMIAPGIDDDYVYIYVWTSASYMHQIKS